MVAGKPLKWGCTSSIELLMAELPMLALIFVKNLRPETGLRQICFHPQNACYAR